MTNPEHVKGEEPFAIGPYQARDEKTVVPLLAACHPHSWGKSSPVLWRWKHLERPGFEPTDVILARNDSGVVGCFHGAILPLRLAPGITVYASYDGDFAVLPEARGNDLTGRVYESTDPELTRKGVAVRGGFTSKELNERHYGKKYGYVFVPTATGSFRKFIGLSPLRSKVEELGKRILARPRLRRALARQPIQVGLAIQGLPEAVLHCSDAGFELVQSPAGVPSISLTLPYRVLATLPDGAGAFVRSFVSALLTRDAKVRGAPTGLVRLLQITVFAALPGRGGP